MKQGLVFIITFSLEYESNLPTIAYHTFVDQPDLIIVPKRSVFRIRYWSVIVVKPIFAVRDKSVFVSSALRTFVYGDVNVAYVRLTKHQVTCNFAAYCECVFCDAAHWDIEAERH